MKIGREITSVVEELKRQDVVKKDYLCDSDALSIEFLEGNNRPVLKGINGPMELTDWAHGQLATFLKIPKSYYNKMRIQEQNLFAENTNTWLKLKKEKKLIRVLDNKVRAFLPQNYRPVDCLDLCTNVLPIFEENKLHIVSSEVTETRTYIKSLLLDKQFEVKSKVLNDVLNLGIAIRGSEVGHGGIKIEPFVHRVVCNNGMIATRALQEFSLTSGDEFGEINKFFSKETLTNINTAFVMKVRDVIKGILSDEIFNTLRNRLQKSVQETFQIKNNEVFIRKVLTTLGISKAKDEVLRNFVEEADFTRYGVMNAITKAANSESNYDFATELEYAGDKVLSLSENQWRVLQNN